MPFFVLAATVLTLRGSSYVSYRVYDWKDRVHSKVNRISLFFKVVFYFVFFFFNLQKVLKLKIKFIKNFRPVMTIPHCFTRVENMAISRII